MINYLSSTIDVDPYCQMELPIKIESASDDKISEIHDLLEQQTREIEQQQVGIQALSIGLGEAIMILYQLQESNSNEDIKAVKQKVDAIDEGMMKIYHYLKEDKPGKELKAGQQNLQKAISSIVEASQKQTTLKVGYLDWKQIATIITATAIISSLCSLTVFQLATNIKIDQKSLISTEKPLKPKTKKTSQ